MAGEMRYLDPFWPAKVVARGAEMFGLTIHQLIGKSRETRYIPARFLTVRALQELGMGPCEIGRRVNRDHSTIPHAIREANRLIAERQDMRLVYEEIVNAGCPGYFPDGSEETWLYPWHRPKVAAE